MSDEHDGGRIQRENGRAGPFQADLGHTPSDDPPHIPAAAFVRGGDEERVIAEVSARYFVSKDAVITVLDALKSTSGRMAQFAHPELGGTCHWSLGLTTIDDTDDSSALARLEAIAGDLVIYLKSRPVTFGDLDGPEVSYRPGDSHPTDWWPAGLGKPSTTGALNRLRYAIFPEASRLAVEDTGSVTVYDTGAHALSGISQAGELDQTMTFLSESGPVTLSELLPVGEGSSRIA